GVYVIGKDVNVMDRAPKAWLTGVSWNWTPMMVSLVEEIQAGTWTPSHVRGDLASGNAVLDPFGEAVSAETQASVLALKEEIISGNKDIWTGPIFKQDGTEVVASDATLSLEAIETMDFLVKGVTGSTN